MGKKLEERKQIYQDVRTGVIPARVPLEIEIEPEFFFLKSGMDLAKAQWTAEGMEEAMNTVLKDLPIDMLAPVKSRNPCLHQIIGSVTYSMGSGGFIQHPEVSVMRDDEYAELIAHPHEFYMQKVLRRYCRNLGDDPIRNAMILAMGIKSDMDFNAAINGGKFKAMMANEIYQVPFQHLAFVTASPTDLIADYLRGFTAFSMDTKRHKKEIIEASEALLPWMLKQSIPAQPSPIGYTAMFTHMPGFMRTKEFEQLYYPTFSKLLHATAEYGQYFCVFLEADWTRYVDYLQDLPQGTVLRIEKGDLQKFKDTLGKKFVLEGSYPLDYLNYATREQAVDRAKEVLDIMAPGGNFIFAFDKGPIRPEDINFENFQAVLEYVAENAKYENAGQRSMPEDFQASIHKCRDQIPPFKSDYLKTYDQLCQEIHYPVEEINDLVCRKVAFYENWAFNTFNTIK